MNDRSLETNFEPCYCAKCDGKLPAPCRYGTGTRTSNSLVQRLREFQADSTGRMLHRAAFQEAAAEIERLQRERQERHDAFKNLHRLLCERFGYFHDEKDWERDQLSLIEWIAKRLPAETPAALTELRALVNNQADSVRFLPVDMALLRRVVGSEKSNSVESAMHDSACGNYAEKTEPELSIEDLGPAKTTPSGNCEHGVPRRFCTAAHATVNCDCKEGFCFKRDSVLNGLALPSLICRLGSENGEGSRS